MRSLLLLPLAAALGSIEPAFADPLAVESSSGSGLDAHFIGDVRGVMLARDDNNYFRHAEKWNYDLSNAAGGGAVSLGAALGSRVAVLGEGFYVVDGADRDTARLRLASGGLLAIVKATVAQVTDKDVSANFAVTGGFGRYYIKETYVEPSLSPMVYSTSASSFGGCGGLEASVTIKAFRAALAYSYQYAPATVSDRVRGTVDAGGHMIAIGVGVKL